MEFTNLTEDLTQTSYKELACSTEFTTEIHNHLIVHLVLNSYVAITAFLGNTLILVALHKESSLHPPSKLLFRNLAATDLCVGLIVGPLFVTYLISALKERWDICRYSFAIFDFTGHILCGVSLFTLTAISVDRLLALLLGLRYRQVVTLKRIFQFVVVFWVVSTSGAITLFWNERITLWYGCVVISLCLVTSIFSYTKIFLTLRHNQVQAQGNVNQGHTSQTFQLNIERYKRTVSSALWVKLALVVCYLPFGVEEIFRLQREITSDIVGARYYSATLIFLSSSLNPILYCWKMREVRQAVKDTIRFFCPSC